MISSILKTAGLITLLFGAWVLFTVQSGKDTGAGRLIDKISNLKTSAISTVKPSGHKKESRSMVVSGVATSANLEGTENTNKEKSGLLVKAGHKKDSVTDDTHKLFNTKTILPEDRAERTTPQSESEDRFDTAAEEPTDAQLQSAQKRLAESIIKLETTINSFYRR